MKGEVSAVFRQSALQCTKQCDGGRAAGGPPLSHSAVLRRGVRAARVATPASLVVRTGVSWRWDGNRIAIQIAVSMQVGRDCGHRCRLAGGRCPASKLTDACSLHVPRRRADPTGGEVGLDCGGKGGWPTMRRDCNLGMPPVAPGTLAAAAPTQARTTPAAHSVSNIRRQRANHPHRQATGPYTIHAAPRLSTAPAPGWV